MQHPTDEYLDLVDKNDKVIGKMKRSEIYVKDLSNFRTINVFLINSKGQIWIPRRTVTKRVFPLCLDMSVGGHVESGETYDQAFKREVKEELNIATDSVDYHILGKVTPDEDNISCFSTVYEIKSDEIPNYNKDDFTEYFWLTPTEIINKINQGDKAKSDLPKLVRIFYLKH
jgi:isopentenyl-diphosphate delta-isomerase